MLVWLLYIYYVSHVPPPRRTACALADFTVYKELDFFFGGGGVEWNWIKDISFLFKLGYWYGMKWIQTFVS